MLFKDADKSINIGKKHKWADTTALDYTTNEVCNVRKTDIADLIIALLSQLIKSHRTADAPFVACTCKCAVFLMTKFAFRSVTFRTCSDLHNVKHHTA